MKNTLLLLLIFSVSASFAQVGINTVIPHISAELDVSSVSRGLLVPRLTTAAITTLSTTASEGLIVFDTDKKVFVGWDGTKWQIFGNLPIQITFASWEVNGISNYGVSPFSATATTQITSATLERGTGLTISGSAASNAWGANGFDNADFPTSIINQDYIVAKINLPSISTFSLTKISANNMRRSTNGPQSFQWQYSLNGISFTDIGVPINLPNDLAVGNNIPEINLSSISALQGLSNIVVTFRIVLYGGTGGSAGTYYINNTAGNDLEIIGTYN